MTNWKQYEIKRQQFGLLSRPGIIQENREEYVTTVGVLA
jgi:hypothetical protein